MAAKNQVSDFALNPVDAKRSASQAKADLIRDFLIAEKDRYHSEGNGAAHRAIIDLLFEADRKTFVGIYDVVKGAE